MKNINIEQFKRDILESDLYKKSETDVSEKVKQYDLILKNLLDGHASVKTNLIAMK